MYSILIVVNSNYEMSKKCVLPLVHLVEQHISMLHVSARRCDKKSLLLLKGNRHELRMHFSKVVCGNMPGFLATFRSRNLLFCLYIVISFAAKDPSYAGSMPP